VIERGGIRFGLFGVLGKEAMIYTNGGATSFSDPVEAAKEMVKLLRETEKVDVVICLSHGGVMKGKDGRFTDGDDVRLAKAVPGIDVVIGGHSHTELRQAILANGRTPVVQTGKEGNNLGELPVSRWMSAPRRRGRSGRTRDEGRGTRGGRRINCGFRDQQLRECEVVVLPSPLAPFFSPLVATNLARHRVRRSGN